jgi:hypothetical protein
MVSYELLIRIRVSLYSLRKKSVSDLILGGAAVYRYDKRFVYSVGFSR